VHFLRYFEKGKGYIRYRPPYAEYRKPYWKDGAKRDFSDGLGRIIDQDRNIFYKNEYGLFSFTVAEGMIPVGDHELSEEQLRIVNKARPAKALLLDFGDAYLICEFLKSLQLVEVFKSVFPEEADTLLSLVMHRVVCNEPDISVESWYDNSYICKLFPKAELNPSSIDGFLEKLGSLERLTEFFDKYYGYLNLGNKSEELKKIIISDFAELNCHIHESNAKASLMAVLDKASGLPLHFNQFLNDDDGVAMQETLRQLSGCIDRETAEFVIKSGCDTDFMIASNIPVVFRLPANENLYKSLVLAEVPDIWQFENLVVYNEILYCVKKVLVKHSDASEGEDESSVSDNAQNKAVAYVVLEVAKLGSDMAEMIQEYRTLKAPELPNNATPEEIERVEKEINKFKETRNFRFLNCGIFIIVSTVDVPCAEILPLYDANQDNEQMIDFFINNCNAIPLEAHSEEAIRGQMLLSFMALVAGCAVNNKLKTFEYGIQGALSALRGLKVEIKNGWATVSAANQTHKRIAKALLVVIPEKFKIS
jgi:hypothetical protein